jgi:hypothetical protein
MSTSVVKLGRPSKLTPETIDRLIGALAAGNYKETAATYAGITISTLNKWLQIGASDIEVGRETEYSALFVAVRAAEAEAEVEAVTAIRLAFGDDWKAAVAFLERRHTQRWGRTNRVELTGAEGGPVQLAQAEIVTEAQRIVQEHYAESGESE